MEKISDTCNKPHVLARQTGTRSFDPKRGSLHCTYFIYSIPLSGEAYWHETVCCVIKLCKMFALGPSLHDNIYFETFDPFSLLIPQLDQVCRKELFKAG